MRQNTDHRRAGGRLLHLRWLEARAGAT
jgi:hypothetical protein